MRNYGKLSRNEAEVMNPLWGLEIPFNLGIHNLVLEGESLLIIESNKRVLKMSWHVMTTIRDAQILLNWFFETKI